MGQYIKKSALVTWLKERIRDYWSDSENTMGIFPYALEEVIKYVDTLEAKEIPEDIDESLSGKDKTMDDTIDYWYLKYLQEKKESEGIMGVLKTGYEKGRADAFIQMQRGWSEEDESKMNNLCHFLEEYGNQYYGNLTLQFIISWLKSLKHQSHWEPSDDQMKTLELIINSHSLDAYHLGMVQHLYNGLKTLKE